MELFEQEKYRQPLLALKDMLAAQVSLNRDEARPVSLDESIGRLARMDRMQQQQVAADQGRRLEQRLQRVESALARIERGEFGVCLECGEDIVEKRLLFQPEVTFCLDCQRARE